MSPLIKSLFKYTALAALGIGLVYAAVANFSPKNATSIVAQAVAPTGEEFYVIQTYKGMAEPYQVSLFGRRPGKEWRVNYLAHQDSSWEGCRIEFVGDTVRVIRDPKAARTFSPDRVFVRNPSTGRTLSLGQAADLPEPANGRPLPADFSSEQLVEWHDKIHGK